MAPEAGTMMVAGAHSGGTRGKTADKGMAL